MFKPASCIILFVAANLALNAQSTFTDPRDGEVYGTKEFGDAVWMTENLRYKCDSGAVAFRHQEKHVADRGYLYELRIAESVCPTGWHLPSSAEFSALVLHVAQTEDEHTQKTYRAFMKDDGGFNHAIAGHYWKRKDQFALGAFPFKHILYCTSDPITEVGTSHSRRYTLYGSNGFFDRLGTNSADERDAYPVRCVRDE